VRNQPLASKDLHYSRGWRARVFTTGDSSNIGRPETHQFNCLGARIRAKIAYIRNQSAKSG
jgi:hypothetical protein